MSEVMIAFLLGLGASAWVYNKMMRQTGNNNTSSLVTGGVCGAVLFLFVWMMLAWLL